MMTSSPGDQQQHRQASHCAAARGDGGGGLRRLCLFSLLIYTNQIRLLLIGDYS
jgi:hypothetical protein